MTEAFKIDPDQHAKTTQLSQASGVPEFAVESDHADVEQNLKLDQIDFSSLTQRSPETSKFLTDFNNAVIAQDDIDILQEIEDVEFFRRYHHTSHVLSLVLEFLHQHL